MKIFTASLFLLFVATVSFVEATSSGTHLKTLLFYTCVTKEVHNQCNESYTMDQAGIVNRGATANFTTIDEGFENGIESLYAAHDVFFINGAGMRSDWKKQWESVKKELEGRVKDGKVVGFFLGDELLSSRKVTLQNFTTALQALSEMKTEYPHLFIWENEGGTGWIDEFKKTGLPEQLDIISFDDYSLSVKEHREFHEKHLYPLLKDHQATFLVPGAYATHHDYKKSAWCNGDGTFHGCDVYMTQRTLDFLNWALEDERIVGFAPWHWDSRGVEEVTPYKEVGVVDMPMLLAEYRKIGKLVRNE